MKGTKPQPGKVSGKPIGRPKKPSTTNGNCPPRSTDSATPSVVADLEDLSPSAKKKRKARKKPVVSILVASLIWRLTSLVRRVHRVRQRQRRGRQRRREFDFAGCDCDAFRIHHHRQWPAQVFCSQGEDQEEACECRSLRKSHLILTHAQSEETVSPEDELDDPLDTSIDEVAMRAAASPLPVRPGK